MRSMTGYGQAAWQRGGRAITVEIRAVNQRFLEVRLNMPREYLAWESELRGLVQEQVARGKVDVSINRGRGGAEPAQVEANVELARAYLAGWQKLQKALKLPGTIDLALLQSRAPDLVRVTERRLDAGAEIDPLRQTLRRALESFNRERLREGRALARDMLARVRHLRQLEGQLSRRAEVLTPQFAARLRERLGNLMSGSGISEERLAQEAAVLADRSDVTEELVRLRSHLEALGTLLRGGEPAGKKLDFLLQEVHREVNTIASKSADLAVTNLTVEARAEIERLREQAQNIE